MAVIAHLLSVTVQLLRASGKTASEQVVMQRAIADLQRESREVREQYLKQRRAIYERKDNSDMIANEASQARRGQVGNSSPTSRPVHQGPLPWQSPSKSTKVPHDTRVLRSSVSLPAVGRDVGVTGHSSESVMALSPTSQREPKEQLALHNRIRVQLLPARRHERSTSSIMSRLISRRFRRLARRRCD